jgi:hypothetical protein
VLNIVALISLMDVPDAALMGHVFWASLLGFLVLWGPGALALDFWLIPRLRRQLLGDDLAAPAAGRARSLSRVA